MGGNTVRLGVRDSFQWVRRSRAPVAHRLMYLGLLAEHVALVVGLRMLRPRRREPKRAGDRLRISFLSPHPPNHLGTVARFTRWVPYLERAGHEVEILCPSTDEEFEAYKQRMPGADIRYHHTCIRNQWRNIRRAAAADVVVLHRGLFPFSPWQRPTFERLLARLNPNLVYDFYDAIWVERRQASRQPSRIARWLHPADKIEQIVRLARVVTVSNDGLAEFARRQNENVRIIPMLLEPRDYDVHRHAERSRVVLGWTGSEFNVPRLLSLAPALQRLAQTRDVSVRVVSPQPVEIPGVPVESLTHPWSPESERADFVALDVGLLPLDDSAHDRDKSPFKLLQYMASGLAVIATPTAIDLTVVEPDESFLAAASEDEWVEAMTRLVDDAALRARLGAAARATVEHHYSFESHADAFIDALVAAAR
jgi:glycosyltransferase involved in cell wall biosynthesis